MLFTINWREREGCIAFAFATRMQLSQAITIHFFLLAINLSDSFNVCVKEKEEEEKASREEREVNEVKLSQVICKVLPERERESPPDKK